jgi:hypothetical protein
VTRKIKRALIERKKGLLPKIKGIAQQAYVSHATQVKNATDEPIVVDDCPIEAQSDREIQNEGKGRVCETTPPERRRVGGKNYKRQNKPKV